MDDSKSLIKLDGPEGAMRLEEFLKNNNCMIRFHMYGCMWCDKMKPEWHKLSDRLSKTNKDVVLLDVDSEAVSNMSSPLTSSMKSSINGFPTIIYSPKGSSERFSKFEDELGRTAENMQSWLESVSKKTSKVKKTKKAKTSKSRRRTKLGGSRRVRKTLRKNRRKSRK